MVSRDREDQSAQAWPTVLLLMYSLVQGSSYLIICTLRVLAGAGAYFKAWCGSLVGLSWWEDSATRRKTRGTAAVLKTRVKGLLDHPLAHGAAYLVPMRFPGCFGFLLWCLSCKYKFVAGKWKRAGSGNFFRVISSEELRNRDRAPQDPFEFNSHFSFFVFIYWFFLENAGTFPRGEAISKVQLLTSRHVNNKVCFISGAVQFHHQSVPEPDALNAL